MKAKLTELSVARIKPPKSGRLDVWDTTLPAFGLRVTATGAKSYVVAIRKPSAKHPSRIKVGEPGRMALADARDAARQMMQTGALPEPEPEDKTFRTLAEQFLGHGRTKRGRVLRAATVKEYRRALLGYAAPLHHRPADEVRRGDIAQLLRNTAMNRGATTAMRTRAALSRFYSWLVANDEVDANVVLGTEGYDVPKRSRVLTDGELAALWAATEDGHDFHLLVRLMLWTGARRGEVGSMRWSDLVDGTWMVDGSRTKNHRPLILPLPCQVLAALDGWPRFVGRDFLFGRGPNGFQAWSQSKRRLDARLGFARDWDIHDCRRTVQTRLLALGVNRDLVNRLLNHAMGPIDQAYDQNDYLPEKAAALQSWADELQRIVDGGEAKVIALR
jgi:integrase